MMTMPNRSLSLFLSILMALAIVSLLAGCGGTANEDDSSDSASAEKAQVEGSDISPEEEIQYFGNETVVVLKTNQGNIFVRFFAEISPEHTKNFISHSESGLYAGTLFHRVIPGFMIQGGDPNSKDENPNNDGMGGYSYLGEGKMLNEEFNDIPHTRGILSMARSQDVNSAGSQFFIMHAAYPSLNGKYTVFGEVIDGIEVVDFIANAPKNRRDRPDEDQRIEEVLVEEWSVAKVEATKKAMMEEDSAVHGQ